MSSNIQSVISRVQKLLALVSGSTNENECAAARAAADKLIQAHRLSQADLESKGESAEPYVRAVVHKGGRRLAWQEVLLSALCNHFGGCFYYTSGRVGGVAGQGRNGSKGESSYTVVATESDAAVIEYMFNYLSGSVDRLARWHCGGKGIAVSIAWRLGCSQGIASQFRDLAAAAKTEAAATGQSAAMVLLTNRNELAREEMNKVPGMKKGTSVPGGRDISARIEGYAEGRKVSINQGLGAKTAAQLG